MPDESTDRRTENGSIELSPQDRAALVRFRNRMEREKPVPHWKGFDVESDTHLAAASDDRTLSNVLAADVFATSDLTLTSGLLDQISQALRNGNRLTESDINFAMSAVRAIDPHNPAEALLAVQMVAIHNATMTAAGRLRRAETVGQQDSASNMLNKLARTFAAQIDALKRYRSTGEQSVRVTHQHVNVTAAQAVVGINQGGGGVHENASQSHAIGTPAGSSEADARGSALLGQEQALGPPMPSAGREGTKCVPDARRSSRSTDRIG